MTDSRTVAGAARVLRLIPIESVEIGERLRAVDADYVQMLAGNIADSGLHTPIEVRPLQGGRFKLIAGGHRIAACMALEYREIEAFVVDADDLTARLREIDENLFRHELNPLDRGAFLAERKALWEELHPEAKQGGSRGNQHVGGQARQSEIVAFCQATALASGYSRRTVEIAIAMFANLAPAVRAALRGSPISRDQSELIRLSKLPPAEQVRVVELLKSPDGPKKVAQAHAIVTGQRAAPPSTEDRTYMRLVDAWGRNTNTRGRRNFLRWLLEEGELDAIAPELLKRRAAEQGESEA